MKKLIINNSNYRTFLENGIPDDIEILSFDDDFDQPIFPLKFPENLMEINFGKKFDKPLNQVKFPSQLKKIIFHPNSKFNFRLKTVNFPLSLEELHFGRHFSHFIPNNLVNLHTLRLGESFLLQELEKILKFPNAYKIKKLIIKNPCPIDNFDSLINLEELEIISIISIKLTNPKLRILKFQSEKSEILGLPESLESLILPMYIFPLPPLPIGLKNLDLSQHDKNYNLDFLPESLESLSIFLKKDFFNNLPKSLKKINLKFTWSYSLPELNKFDHLTNLQEITFDIYTDKVKRHFEEVITRCPNLKINWNKSARI